mgnify:CR=1 FL=1
MKFYQVNVELQGESDKGKPTKIREQYLVWATSCLDAETTTVKKFVDEGNTLDFKVKSIRETKVLEVLGEDVVMMIPSAE